MMKDDDSLNISFEERYKEIINENKRYKRKSVIKKKLISLLKTVIFTLIIAHILYVLYVTGTIDKIINKVENIDTKVYIEETVENLGEVVNTIKEDINTTDDTESTEGEINNTSWTSKDVFGKSDLTFDEVEEPRLSYTENRDTEVYKVLANAANNYETNIQLKATEEEIKETVGFILRDPKYFWYDTSYSYSCWSDLRSELKLQLKYSDIETKQTEIENKVAEILSGIDDTMTDYNRALYVYDWMIENIEYGYAEDNSDQDIYGALINGRCVCAGYAKTFKFLLNKLGIYCDYIEGTATTLEDNKTETHAWNLVEIDGKCAYFDVTWDDNDNNTVKHQWFGVSADMMARSHTADSRYKTVYDTSLDLNYISNIGNVLITYDIDKLAEMIKNSFGNKYGVVEVRCYSEETFNIVKDKIHNTNELYDAMEKADVHNSINAIGISDSSMCIFFYFE